MQRACLPTCWTTKSTTTRTEWAICWTTMMLACTQRTLIAMSEKDPYLSGWSEWEREEKTQDRSTENQHARGRAREKKKKRKIEDGSIHTLQLGKVNVISNIVIISSFSQLVNSTRQLETTDTSGEEGVKSKFSCLNVDCEQIERTRRKKKKKRTKNKKKYFSSFLLPWDTSFL